MKTTANILSLLFILSLSSQVFAQLDDFDLSKYKVTDYKRQELNFNFQTNGSNYSSNSKSFSDTNNIKRETFGFQLSMGYNNYINTRKQQQTIKLSANINPFNYNFDSDNNNIYLPRTTKNSAYAITVNVDKKLYNANNFFIGFANSTQYEFDRNKLKSKSTNSTTNQIIKTESITKIHSIYQNISFSVGKGRIEYVEDARMAVFILEDLLKNNKLEQQPSENEILDFSRKITQLKNKRFFDSRIRKKYEIQAIDSFLRNSHLTNSQDAIYFASLFDNWNYSNNPQRQSGSRISLEYNPNLIYYSQKSDDYTYFSSNLTHNISVKYSYAKPLNLKWQRDIFTGIGFSHNYYRGSYPSNENKNWLFIDFGLNYGFYPDSRSYYTLNINASTRRILKTDDSNASFDYNLQIGLSAFYYISERFQLNANAGLMHNYDITYFEPQDITNKIFSPSFSIYLTYNLF